MLICLKTRAHQHIHTNTDTHTQAGVVFRTSTSIHRRPSQQQPTCTFLCFSILLLYCYSLTHRHTHIHTFQVLRLAGLKHLRTCKRCQTTELVGWEESGSRLVETLRFCLPQTSAGETQIWTHDQRLPGAERLHRRADLNPIQIPAPCFGHADSEVEAWTVPGICGFAGTSLLKSRRPKSCRASSRPPSRYTAPERKEQQRD